MRLFLDLCVTRLLIRHLSGHECTHASRVPWGESKNGALIRQATEAGFEALITVDANMPFQTRLTPDSLPVVLLAVHTNRLEDLLPLIETLVKTLPTAPRGVYTVIPLLEEPPTS